MFERVQLTQKLDNEKYSMIPLPMNANTSVLTVSKSPLNYSMEGLWGVFMTRYEGKIGFWVTFGLFRVEAISPPPPREEGSIFLA